MLMYKKITNGGYSLYIPILKVLLTFLLQESSARWRSWKINMTKYGKGGAGTVSPFQTVVDTEQIRNLQKCETYGIHVSGTKNKV